MLSSFNAEQTTRQERMYRSLCFAFKQLSFCHQRCVHFNPPESENHASRSLSSKISIRLTGILDSGYKLVYCLVVFTSISVRNSFQWTFSKHFSENQATIILIGALFSIQKMLLRSLVLLNSFYQAPPTWRFFFDFFLNYLQLGLVYNTKSCWWAICCEMSRTSQTSCVLWVVNLHSVYSREATQWLLFKLPMRTPHR